MLVGGGTGGHITPLLAVAHELKKHDAQADICVVTDNNAWLSSLQNSADISHVTVISAGKLRRYPNQSWLQKITDIKTISLNLRDAFRTFRGCWQALRAIGRSNPDIIFIKGGFVGVPVGVAAHIKRVPFITHDSDTKPGLANKIIGRWAAVHAVGMPSQFYTYPKQKTVHVGIPLTKNYKHVSDKLKLAYRRDLELPARAHVVAVTGGSQGAARINKIVKLVLKELTANEETYLLHQTGNQTNDLPSVSSQYRPFAYRDDLYKVTGAADVVIARAGASTLAELATQEKAVIVIPSPFLASGHQLENAKQLQEKEAVIMLDETKLLNNPFALLNTVQQLLNDTSLRKRLSRNLRSLYLPDSAARIAELIIKTGVKPQ